MKYNIHITHAAERDMANAYDYIDLVLKNPTAADKLLDVADEKIGALAEFPHKFEVVSDKLLSLWGIRFTIVMNYLAFYTVDDATQTVHRRCFQPPLLPCDDLSSVSAKTGRG